MADSRPCPACGSGSPVIRGDSWECLCGATGYYSGCDAVEQSTQQWKEHRFDSLIGDMDDQHWRR